MNLSIHLALMLTYSNHLSIIYETLHSHIFHVMSLSSPDFVGFNSYSIYIAIEKDHQSKNIRRILLTNKKYIIVSKVVSFFLEIQRILITLYVGYPFCIIQKDSQIFIDMSVLYRKKSNYSF